MKKRFLSAALALAMVLTLLPATVFADDPVATDTTPLSGKTTVQYVAKNDFSKKNESGATVSGAWAWQYKGTDGKMYWTGKSDLGGIVNGVGGSGVWYEDLDAFTNKDKDGNKTTLKSTSFTLLEAQTNFDPLTATTLSINLFGNNLTFGSGKLALVNTLTITDTYATQYGEDAGTVDGLTRNVGTYKTIDSKSALSTSGLTLRITGANVDNGISLTGRGNKVYLTGVAVTGAISLNGTTAVTTQKTVSGATSDVSTATSYDAQTLEIKTQPANLANGVPLITSSADDTITVIGNGSSVSLTDVNGKTSATGLVSVESTGGTVKVDGIANLGTLRVGCGPKPATNSKPAAVTINSGDVSAFNRVDSTTEDATPSTATGSVTVNKDATVGSLQTDNGDVTVNSGTVTGNLIVRQGSLTISGSGVEAATGSGAVVSLGYLGKTTLKVSGTGHKVGNIQATDGKNLTISEWPASRLNTFGTLTLNGYTGGGIKGGIFGTNANSADTAAYFSGLQFIRKTTDSKYAYYGPKELAAAIADAGDDAKDGVVTAADGTVTFTAADVTLSVMGSTVEKYFSFYNSTIDLAAGPEDAIAHVGYGRTTGIYLPDVINGTKVTSWTNVEEAKTYDLNTEVPISSTVDAGKIKLVIQSTGAAVSRLTNAESAGANPNVTVTLNNSQVILSGAVGQEEYEDIVVKFTTDLIGSNGEFVTFNVPVAYNTTTKTAGFATLGLSDTIPYGVTVNTNNVVVGGNTYTLVTSALAKPASNLEVADMPGYNNTTSANGKGIVVTVNVSGMTDAAKQNLITAISGGSAEFDWTASPAMRQAVNAALATITNDKTLEGWVTTVQRAAWNIKNQGVTPTSAQLGETGFNTVVLVPYLQMTVTAYNQSGTMTATLVPSYRVEVRGGTGEYDGIFLNRANGTADGNYIIQAGKALPALNSNLTGASYTTTTGGTATTVQQPGVELTFNSLPTGFNGAIMHQDGTYVYEDSSGTYTITHAGKTGLGTIVLNSTPATVELARVAGAIDQNGQTVAAGGTTTYYDTLQAAVDDTLPQYISTNMDTITVKSGYASGAATISVSGEARTFKIKTEGNTTIGSNANADLVSVTGGGHEYVVQLLKNNVTNASIVVKSVDNGTAVITSEKVTAKPGETVTIAVAPKAGYQTSKVEVKTNKGDTVTATKNEDGTFSFKVPDNATRVEVTPVFTLATALPFTDVPATASYYNAVKYCYDHSLIQGNTLTTFNPNGSINRGQIVLILYRQANSPNVSVNNYLFTDMPTYDAEMCRAIAWANSNKIVEGYPNGSFKPGQSIKRQELAAILYRYQTQYLKGTANSYVNLNNYVGGSSVQDWAQPGMRWAVGNGIITAQTNGLAPTESAPRYQAAEAMYAYLLGVRGIV